MSGVEDGTSDYEVVYDGDPGPDTDRIIKQPHEVMGHRSEVVSFGKDSGVGPVLRTSSWGIRQTLDDLDRTDLDIGMIEVTQPQAMGVIRECGARVEVRAGTLMIHMDDETDRVRLQKKLRWITGNDGMDHERVDEVA